MSVRLLIVSLVVAAVAVKDEDDDVATDAIARFDEEAKTVDELKLELEEALDYNRKLQDRINELEEQTIESNDDMNLDQNASITQELQHRRTQSNGDSSSLDQSTRSKCTDPEPDPVPLKKKASRAQVVQLRACSAGGYLAPALALYADAVFEASKRGPVTSNTLYDMAVDIPGKVAFEPKANVQAGGSRDVVPFYDLLGKAMQQHTKNYLFVLQGPCGSSDWPEQASGERPKAFLDRMIRRMKNYGQSMWPSYTFLHLNAPGQSTGTDRIYISCSADDYMGRAHIFVEIMKLTNTFKGLKAKVAGTGENRRDCIVVWTDKPVEVVKALRVVEDAHPSWFGDAPPPLVRPVSRAMGYAQEPHGGSSFNSLYKGLIQQSMVMDPAPPADNARFKENVAKVVKKNGIDPCQPEMVRGGQSPDFD